MYNYTTVECYLILKPLTFFRMQMRCIRLPPSLATLCPLNNNVHVLLWLKHQQNFPSFHNAPYIRNIPS